MTTECRQQNGPVNDGERVKGKQDDNRAGLSTTGRGLRVDNRMTTECRQQNEPVNDRERVKMAAHTAIR